MTIFLAIVIGAAFGFVLDRTGATSPNKIVKMLNLTNMHLAKTIMLAIGVGSIGTLGKLTSEAIEAVPTGPGEATRSTGAGTLQTLRWAVTPQILPEVIAFWLYRFEINIRASAILGILGAGGVGSLLAQVFERRDWERIGITLTVIIVVTVIVDQISGAVRHRVISGVPVAGAKALV